MNGLFGACLGVIGTAVLLVAGAADPVPLTASIAAETTASVTVLAQPGQPIAWTVTGPGLSISAPPPMAPPALAGAAQASSGNVAVRLTHAAPSGLDFFAVYFRPPGSSLPWGMAFVPAGSDVWCELPGAAAPLELRLSSYVGAGSPAPVPPP